MKIKKHIFGKCKGTRDEFERCVEKLKSSQKGVQRFMSVDPLADQFPSHNPYNYTFNNPINMIDPDGRAPEHVDPDGILNSGNDDLISSFNRFASSEEGQAILSKYASAGQTIAGHTYEADGEYHSQGIDLSFNAWKGNSQDSEGSPTSFGANGVTRTTETESGGLDIGVFINSEINSSSNPDSETDFINSRMGTIFHETSIHADGNSADFTRDCTLNCSNISNHFGLSPSTQRNRTAIQHRNAKLPGSNYSRNIIPAIISISKAYGSKSSRNEIKNRTLNFQN